MSGDFKEGPRKQVLALDGMLLETESKSMIGYLNNSYVKWRKSRVRLKLNW